MSAAAAASPAQIDANRANAQLSTGPTSEAGKRASSANATTLGLTGIRIFVPPGDEEAFESFRDLLKAEINPSNLHETHLFDVLLHAAWNISRCLELEAKIQDEAREQGLEDALLDDTLSRKLDRIYRYKKMHESTHRRITAELRTLQTEAIWRRENQTFVDDSILPLTAKVGAALQLSERRADKHADDQLRHQIETYMNPVRLRKPAA